MNTARLRLRRWQHSDAAAFVDMYGREEVYRFLGSVPTGVYDFDEARARIDRWNEQSTATVGRWAVTIGADGVDARPVGTVVLTPLPRTDLTPNDDKEIGWHFHPDAWGHGYATEAAGAMIALARASRLREVRAVVHPTNHASRAVADRLGMTCTGLTDRWYGVELYDYVLGLTRTPDR